MSVTVPKYCLTHSANFAIFAHMQGVRPSKTLVKKLDEMRIKHRLSFQQIGAAAQLSGETIRRVLKNGSAIRDVHAVALKELVDKYERGAITFDQSGKAIEGSAA
jgi:hypothetical protein